MDKMHTSSFELTAASNLDEYLLNVLNEKETDDTIINPLNNLLTRFVISKYLILTLKEEIITKPKNSTYDNTLLFSNVESIALAITDKQSDNRYNMNGKVFDDPNTVIAYVRNKLAHGDYALSDDYKYIIFAPEGEYVSVEVIRIECLADKIANVFGEYRSAKEYTRGICVLKNNKPINRLFKTVTDQDINDILYGMRIVKFDLKSKEDLISKEDYTIFDNFLDSVKNSASVLLKDNVDNIKELIKEISRTGSFNSTLDVSLMELSNDERDYIRVVFRKIYGENVSYHDALDYLANLTERTLISKYNNFYSNLEAFKMLRMMQLAFTLKSSDFKNISSRIFLAGKLYGTGKFEVNHDWIALSQIFKLMSLSSFFENNNIHYDIFDLFNILPKTFIIKDNRETELVKQIESWSNKIANNKSAIENKRIQLTNLEASTLSDEVKENKRKDILSVIKEVEKAKKSNIKEMKKSKKELDLLVNSKKDNKKYYYNKYLLEYIRNSICHGNVDIIPAGTPEETIIRFRDYDKGDVVFEYELTVGQIHTLLQANILKIQLYGIVSSANKKQL